MLNADDPTVASRLIEVEQGLRARLQQELGFSLVEKQGDLLSKAIAWSLDGATLVKDIVQCFGVDIPLSAPSGKSFLEGFATTIGPRIAMPSAWLEATGSAAATRLYVFPHEWQHVKQFTDGVSAGKWPKITTHSVLYLAGVVAHTTDGEEYVGKVEGDAYAVSACVRWFFSGIAGRDRQLPRLDSSLVQPPRRRSCDGRGRAQEPLCNDGCERLPVCDRSANLAGIPLQTRR